MKLIALLLLCLNPGDDVVRERCDLVELNGLYDEQGRLVFDQVIWYDWSAPHERYMVRAWRLVKDGKPSPEYDHGSGQWRCLWNDGEITRCVMAGSYRRTWEQFDPELIEREYLPKERRKELLK